MKRMIRLLPILFALPLLGLIPNSQRVEKAEATISTSEQYYITDEGKTLGFNKTGDNTVNSVAYSSLDTVYDFTLVESSTYTIAIHGTDQLLCYRENYSQVKFFSSSSIGAGYDCNWVYGKSGTHAYLKAKNGTNDYYLGLYNNSDWKSLMDLDSSKYLSIFTVGEDSTPFVTAMSNIKCDYSNKSPDTGEWDAAGDVFDDLKQPTKDYLRDLEADKTEGDINTPERAVAKYDYIVNKYNKGGVVYTEFITGRSTSGLVNIDNSTLHSNSVTNTPIIIVISFITVLSFTSILILKKKR